MTYPTVSFDTLSRYIQEVRQHQPLIHCLTNEVVQSVTANTLLAAGISPAMIVAQQEIAPFVAMADGLLINIGTIYQTRTEAMLVAAQTAHQQHKPWVLDPVAVGALSYRTEFAHHLLNYQPTVIRGNASEIMVLAGLSEGGKGPDSTASVHSALPAAQQLALRYHCIVVVTGEIDYATNGKSGWSIHGGTPLMTKVTGCGCALSALIAGYIAIADDHLLASACACTAYALAGEYAAQHCNGPGSFLPLFLDAIYSSSYLNCAHGVCIT